MRQPVRQRPRDVPKSVCHGPRECGRRKHRGIRIPKVSTFFKQMEEKMDRLKGKVILISGGARGQGAAEARLFAAEGARVVIGDVLEPEGRQLASELGHAAAFVRQDVTQERDWQTAVNAAEELGGLHGLVNNAGIYQPGTLMETDI